IGNPDSWSFALKSSDTNNGKWRPIKRPKVAYTVINEYPFICMQGSLLDGETYRSTLKATASLATTSPNGSSRSWWTITSQKEVCTNCLLASAVRKLHLWKVYYDIFVLIKMFRNTHKCW